MATFGRANRPIFTTYDWLHRDGEMAGEWSISTTHPLHLAEKALWNIYDRSWGYPHRISTCWHKPHIQIPSDKLTVSYIFQMAIQKSLEAQLKHLKPGDFPYTSAYWHMISEISDSVVWAGPAYLLAKSTTPAPALEQLAPNSPPPEMWLSGARKMWHHGRFKQTSHDWEQLK